MFFIELDHVMVQNRARSCHRAMRDVCMNCHSQWCTKSSGTTFEIKGEVGMGSANYENGFHNLALPRKEGIYLETGLQCG